MVRGSAGARDLWRLSVPQTAPVLELPEPPLVEWHGGQRWVARRAAARPSACAQRGARGGRPRHAVHAGAARLRAAGTLRFAPPAPPLDRIHRELKRQFDPAGIFNRGRLYPDF